MIPGFMQEDTRILSSILPTNETETRSEHTSHGKFNDSFNSTETHLLLSDLEQVSERFKDSKSYKEKF